VWLALTLLTEFHMHCLRVVAKRLILGALLVRTAAGCREVQRPETARTTDSTRAADLAAIERLHQADMRAVVAGDTTTLISLWTEDIVALTEGAPISVGRDSNVKILRRSLELSRDLEPIDYVLEFQSVELLGDHALEWGTYHGRVRQRSGSIVAYQGKVMRLLRRQPDRSWRVARTMYTQEAETPHTSRANAR